MEKLSQKLLPVLHDIQSAYYKYNITKRWMRKYMVRAVVFNRTIRHISGGNELSASHASDE
jgi:hypothetical protein